MLVALAATAGVLLAVPALSSPALLVVANVALWFVVVAAAPVLNLVVVEGSPVEEWNPRIGLLNAYQGYGWVAGLVVGTVWTAAAPRYLPPGLATRGLFVVLGVGTLVATLLTYRWYPDPVRLSPEQFLRVYRGISREGWGAGRYLRTLPYGPSRVYWALAELRRGRAFERFSGPLRRYFLAATLFSVGFAVFWGPMPAYLTELGHGEGVVFGLFLAANVGSAICYAPVGRASATLVGSRPPPWARGRCCSPWSRSSARCRRSRCRRWRPVSSSSASPGRSSPSPRPGW